MRYLETLDNQWTICPLAELYNGEHYCPTSGWPPSGGAKCLDCCTGNRWRECDPVMKKHMEKLGL
jgi:hypothetical protein